MTAGGQAPTHGGPVSARGVSRLAWSGAITAIMLVATSVALFVQGAGRLEDFGGPDALAAVAYSVVGALVVSRRPGNRIGWLGTVALRRPRADGIASSTRDQIAKISSSNATASRLLVGSSTASS